MVTVKAKNDLDYMKKLRNLFKKALFSLPIFPLKPFFQRRQQFKKLEYFTPSKRRSSLGRFGQEENF
jgi:hypothetical protein